MKFSSWLQVCLCAAILGALGLVVSAAPAASFAAAGSADPVHAKLGLTRNDPIIPFNLTVAATPNAVWANGLRQAQITATLTALPGKSAVGKQISLATNSSNAIVISPSQTLRTDDNGQAVFSVSATDLGAVQFTVTFRTISANTTITFQKRKVVLQVQGINTTLKCKTNGDCNGSTTDFAKIRNSLLNQGFTDKDFLWYSYSGGQVDPDTGVWIANSYKCEDTAQGYPKSIQALSDMVATYGKKNPNTEIYLVGHSQGGLVALQELAALDDLPGKTSVAAIITLDSPLGGIPKDHVDMMDYLDNITWVRTFGGVCWTYTAGNAANQMVQLYNSAGAANAATQGSSATLLCVLVNQCASIKAGTTNAAAVAAKKDKVKVLTFGNDGDDAVYHPYICQIQIGKEIDNSSSEWISGAGGYHEAMGVPTPQPSNPITKKSDFDYYPTAKTKDALYCTSNGHVEVFTHALDSITAAIGSQYPAGPRR